MKIFFSRGILLILFFFVITSSSTIAVDVKNKIKSNIKSNSSNEMVLKKKKNETKVGNKTNKINNKTSNNVKNDLIMKDAIIKNNKPITINLNNKNINNDNLNLNENKITKNNLDKIKNDSRKKNNSEKKVVLEKNVDSEKMSNKKNKKEKGINTTKKNSNTTKVANGKQPKITNLSNAVLVQKKTNKEENKKINEGENSKLITINSIIDKLEKTLIPEIDEYLNINSKVFEQKILLNAFEGAVLNGNKKDGYLLNLALEKYSKGHWVLQIKKNSFKNIKLFKTFLQNDSFFIEIDTNLLKKKAINFTYNVSKDVRLKYQKQKDNYRIVLYFPSKTKITMKRISKEKILVNFINQDLLDKQKAEREFKIKQKILDLQKISNKTLLNNEKTVIFNGETNGFSEIDENITFGKINLKHKKPLVVVIDAGHGGIDPGAISAKGRKEKDITLMYAKSLEKELKKNKVHVIMTRKTDKTLALLERTYIAKRANADLFISIHADAHENSKASGTTVYRLLHLNDSHRDWNIFYNKSYLPKRYENITDRNALNVLVDMAHQVVIENSSIMVDNILLSLKKNGFCKSCRYGKNSFAVLRGLDAISVLIEIGYITNIEEEKKILLASNVKKFAVSLADVIVKTFD